MDWLFDHRSLVYLFLASDLIIILAVWWRTRKRALLVFGGITLLMMALFALVDFVVRGETDEEKLRRSVREMALHLKRPVDSAKAGEYVSEGIESKKRLTKSDFVKEIAQLSDKYGVRDVQVSEFRDISIDRAAKTASMRFNVT